MIRLTTLGAFGKKQETHKSVNENRTKLDFRGGDVEFVVQINNGSLVLLPMSDGIDKMQDIGVSESDMIEALEKKTKLKFEKDRTYRGAGYGFVIDPDYLNKLL